MAPNERGHNRAPGRAGNFSVTQPHGHPRARRLDFSLSFFPMGASPSHYELLMDAARFADTHRFAAVWMPERHFSEFGAAFPNPSVTAAALSVITDRVSIRAGSVVLPLHHPVRVAEEWALVDNLSRGRAGLAFAPGWDKQAELLAPPSPVKHEDSFYDNLDIVRRLWRGEEIYLGGRAEVEVRLRPRPISSELPVWISSGGNPVQAKRAAQIGAGLLTHLLKQSPRELAAFLSHYLSHRPEGGHCTLMLHTAITDDAAELASLRNALRHYAAESAGWIVAEGSLPGQKTLVERAVERFAGEAGLVGPTEQCIQRALGFYEMGVDEIACLIDFDRDLARVRRGLSQLERVRQGCAERLGATSPPPARSGRALSLAENIETWEVKHLQCTPTLALHLLRDPRTRGALSRLSVIMLGGEPCSENLLREMKAATSARIFNMYGPTEATIWSTAAEVTGAPEKGNNVLPIVVGRPLCNTRVYILDPFGWPCLEGVIGELCLAGAGVASGYLGLERETKERFGPWQADPLREELLYRTGDRARFLPGGQIELLGRDDRQRKIAGYRIELSEIEALARLLPGVVEAVASVDEEGKLALSLIGTDCASRCNPGEVRAHLAQHLPFSLIPHHIDWIDEPRRTLSGKLDRAALTATGVRQQESASSRSGAEDIPSVAHSWDSQGGDADLEVMLRLWREVLKTERVAADSDYFALGGASLAAMTLIARVREAFQTDVPLRALFEAPTPRALLGSIAPGTQREIAPALVRGLPPAVESELERCLPLSPAQEQLWCHHELAPSDPAYHDALHLRITGILHADALEAALQHVVQRHESLRAVFERHGETVVQRVRSRIDFSLDRADLRDLSPALRGDELRRLLIAHARQPFDLEKGLPLRAVLLRTAEDSHRLLLTVHHIVCDGWGLSILLDEVVGCYDATVAGRQPILPETPDLAAFVHEQRNVLAGPRGEELGAFWHTTLDQANFGFELKAERVRGEVSISQGASRRIVIPGDVATGVTALARQFQSTPFMILSTAFGILLHEFTYEENLVFGTDVANRSLAFHRLVASAANQLVLPLNLSGDPSFVELLRQMRSLLIGAYQHQDMPFCELVRRLQPPRLMGRKPLFQIGFTLQEGQPLQRRMGSVTLAQEPLDYGIARLDLEVNLQQSGEEFVGTMIYRPDLFAAELVVALQESLLRILRAAARAPAQAISAFALEFAELRGHSRHALCGPDQTEPSHSFLELFAEQVQRAPQAVALKTDALALTYGELAERVERMAAGLWSAGVRPEDIVPLLCEREGPLPVAILALFRIGASFLLLDPEHPQSRNATIVSLSKTGFLLSERRCLGRCQDIVSRVATPQVRILTFEDLREDFTLVPSPPRDPSRFAYVCFTSGSTGVPKGAQITHRGLLNHLLAKVEVLALTSSDIIAQTAPQTFDIFVWQLLVPLLIGAHVRIYGPATANDAETLSRALAADRVTVLEIVPSLLRVLAKLGTTERNLAPPCALRWLISTGEVLDPALVRSWFERYPAIPIVNAYGPAECSDDVSHHIIEKVPEVEQLRVPIGRPIRNTRLYIMNRGLRPVPQQAVGELVVGGPCVGRGYLYDEPRTASAFVADPFSANPAARLYRTGDLACIRADGELEFLGRADQQVKLRGQRIELEEIAAVARRHHFVRDALVTLWTEPENRHLAAFIVINEEAVNVAEGVAETAGHLQQWEAVHD